MAMINGEGKVILVLDIGNTRTHVGIFKRDRIIDHWKISSRESRAGDEYWVYLKRFLELTGVEAVDGVVVASVVPRLTQTYLHISRKRLNCEPVCVTGDLDLGIELCVDRAGEVGADRIANSVAVSEIYNKDAIVVDIGTATTFDVVSKEKQYLGGLIAPGIETSASRLFEKTAKLPKVEFYESGRVIGKNTEDAIRSGVFYGAISQIDGIVSRIIKEWERSPVVIATGGLAVTSNDHLYQFSKAVFLPRKKTL
jgi:type III pantothenate kinase